MACAGTASSPGTKNTIRSPRSSRASSRSFSRARPPASCFPPIPEFRARWRRPEIGILRRASVWPIRPTGLGAGKTSIRASYGMFYTAIEALTIGISSANAPYGTTYTSPAPPLFSTPFVTAANGQNMGQYFPVQLAPLNTSGQPSGCAASIGRSLNPSAECRTMSTNNKIPYTEEYMLSIERGLGNNTVLSASYVGTQSHHLLVLEEANPGNPALCLQLSNPANLAPGQTPCGPFNESNVFTTASGQVINGTRGPLGPNFGSDTHRDHHRQLQLQLAASHLAAYQRTAAVAGGIYLQQVARSIFQSGRRSEPAQSVAEQGACPPSISRRTSSSAIATSFRLTHLFHADEPLDAGLGIFRDHALQHAACR